METTRKIAGMFCVLLWSWSNSSSAVPVTFYNSYAGNINFQATGATLRTQPNSGDSCAVSGPGTTVTATLVGVPAGATIRAAFLYWAGSYSTAGGSTQTTPDTSVVFQGSTVNASRLFTEPFFFGGTTYDFFSGFAEVTALVSGNGTYGLSGLTVNTGAPHCAVSAVVGGWSLIVVYEDAGEPLRVLNVFDGLQYFRGGSVDLNPNNFQIPASGCAGSSDCKFGVLTWEGDVENSGGLGGFTEDLFINPPPPPAALTDANNPSGNQYNSTVSLPDVAGAPNTTTSYGLDLDVYALTTPAHLNPGDTSAVTRYQSGADLVLLNTEIFMVRNTPVADLTIDKSHSGDFVAGQQGVYTLTVSNNGPNDETTTITLSDTLPAGLTYVSATSTDGNWNCGAVGQTVTCTHPGPLANGSSLAAVTLTVDVNASAAPSVNNTATVGSATFDNIAANDSDTDPTNVLVPDLSTSVKSVVDLNGGDVEPGDTLRYTVSINETGGIAVSGVSVSDSIDVLLTGFNVVNIPAGASDNSTASSGPLDVSDINIAANGSVDIVFDVSVAGTANPGDAINNTAVITNPATGATTNAAAPAVIVSASSIPSSGIKNLYTYFDTNTLSRVVPTANTVTANIADNGGSVVLSMTPSTQSALTLGNGVIQIPLCLDRQGNFGFAGRDVTVTLDYAGGSNGTIGSQTQNGILTANGYQLVTFNVNLAADVTLNTNTALRLTVTNDSPAAGNRAIRISSLNCATPSQVQLNANTVINVDSVDAYDAVYPGGVVQASYVPNTAVYLRAAVSDPFGSFDINGANIEIIDALGAVAQASTPMTLVNDSGVAVRTYEYSYTIPAAAADGTWTARITANEGSEGTVSDLGVGTFIVGLPAVSLLKLISTVSDPVNAGSNPKSIPGAIVEFQITAINSGYGPADTGSVVITDVISSDLQLFLGNPADPVQFSDGSPASGLSYTFIDLANMTDDIDFSNDGGTTFITPSVDTNGFDVTVPPIDFIRVTPGGRFNGSTGGGDPNFTIRLRARVR